MHHQIVIAFGGLHGTGKTTYAEAIAQEFGLRHISAGGIFRRLAEEDGATLEEFTSKAESDSSIDRRVDDALKKEAEHGFAIIDGQLAARMAGENADLKIFLTAPDDVRFRRIADRDDITVKEAERITGKRESRERMRFKNLYGIDVKDLSVYYLIIDTSLLPLKETMKTLKNIVSDYIQEKAER